MGVIDNARDIVKLVKDIGNMELYRKILDLQAEVTDLVQDKIRLTNQVHDLTKKLEIQGGLEFKQGAYWHKTSDGKKDGPFCSACWDADKKAIHLIEVRGAYACPVCRTVRSIDGSMLSDGRIAHIKMTLGSDRKKR